MIKNKQLTIGLSIVILIGLLALFAPFIAPYHPIKDTSFINSLESPSWDYLFGTDRMGRDILSRVIFGTRIALLIGLVTQTLNTFIGTTLGLIAGFTKGWLDDAIMGLVNVVLSTPVIVLALALMVLLGPGLVNIIIALGIVNWAYTCRIARSETLSTVEKGFVEAAHASGASPLRIIFKHILPAIAGPVLVVATLGAGDAILIGASLSFLGVGVQPPQPGWGLMVNQGLDFIWTAPWMTLFPGVAIMILTLGLNLFGDGLRDQLDPKLEV
ncbi:MAG: ABC transporter permease [Candidatus Bipolaricaulota bacterium]